MTDYKKYMVYPQNWTESLPPAAPELPTQVQVETFMKTFLTVKPIEEQDVIEKVVIQFGIPHADAKLLVEAVEKKWHPEKYKPVVVKEPIIEEP